ncbi:MAG: hypothetical protein HN727_13390 [Opitutae bacterium]|nr:hypothetical protein [Opitutae bacterium]
MNLFRPSPPVRIRGGRCPITMLSPSAMEAMRISVSRRAVVLVDEIQPNQFGELYESNGIEIMTTRQFSERKWFPPLADQSELDLND